MAHEADTADELGTVLFGYARRLHVVVDRDSHSSHAIDMDRRGSPLITANFLQKLHCCARETAEKALCQNVDVYWRVQNN